ncbi:hypothetical protein TUSST3_23680 [Streptomyces sp. TUS-ST3]|nr:hypothetical protein TUSST3_23680 [Streptomyces sp. TUS-ST3]
MPSLGDQHQRILEAVYDEVDGQVDVHADVTDVATRVALSDQDLQGDLSYLEAKGLLGSSGYSAGLRERNQRSSVLRRKG